jgi:methylenetetrahydrofolate dehydrogenase (NAD+)
LFPSPFLLLLYLHLLQYDVISSRIRLINRSKVFGYPLAQMLANAGAIVYSRDIEDILLFSRLYDKVITTEIMPSDHDHLTRNETGDLYHNIDSELLRSSDLIISAVPGYKMENAKLRPGCGLINVATGNNFCQELIDQSGWYVPRVGAITRRCLLINALIARVAREQGVEIGGQGTRHEER